MAYLPELHYCCICGEYLGHENGDGICSFCDTETCICEHDVSDHGVFGCTVCPCAFFRPPDDDEEE